MKLTPTAKIESNDDGLWVSVHWDDAGVDRPSTFKWSVGSDVPAKRKLAQRLVSAVQAGAALTNTAIAEDVNGKTYVKTESRVVGRYMNADLMRLGF